MALGLKTRGFSSYLCTQFLGAFNDNAFRFAVIFFIQAMAIDEAEKGRWFGVSQVLFAMPFVIFAALAGSVADRVSKSTVIRWAKVGEVLVMLAGVAAFASGELWLLLAVLLLMSTQSAFFGPAKYGYLAETIDERSLVRANGLVQLTTMVAIVAGQVTGGVISDAYSDALSTGALWFVGFAVVGTVVSMGVPLVAAARPGLRLVRNPLPDLAETMRVVLADRTLLFTILGNMHFYLLVACLQINLPDYALQELQLTSRAGAGSLAATATLGIGLGSVLAGRWSGGRVELGLVPLGALTMSVGLAGLALVEVVPLPVPGDWAQWMGAADGGTVQAALDQLLVHGLWAPFAACLVMGIAGGLYIVPLWALLQQSAPAGQKGRFLAFGNMVGFLGIALSAVFLWLPRALELSFKQQFLVIAGLAFAGTFVSLRLLPYAFLRFIAWLLAHTFYRINVLHEDRLPKSGGALILANHVSWVDALILSATTRRGMHFLMYRGYYEWWPMHWLFKLVGCIPVASGDDPALTRESLRRAGDLLDQGKLVVIFGEGAVTRLGHMLPFRTGYQKVIAGRTAPIIPVHLGGLWGSALSHEGGRFLFKIPRSLPYPVSVTFGDALPPTSPPPTVRHAIRKLSGEAWAQRQGDWRPLHITLLREGRRRFAKSLHEGRRSLSVGRLLARSVLLARRLPVRQPARPPASLDGRLGSPPVVAVLGPPGIDGLVTQLALLFAGRVPCLIEEPLDAAELAAASDCELIIDVRPREDQPQEPTEDGLQTLRFHELVRAEGGAGERLAAVLLALLPGRLATALACRGHRARSSDPAVALLNGASLAQPSHFQLRVKIEGLRQVMGLTRDDALLAWLPTSRCHGLVLAQWLPLLAGLPVAWPEVGEGSPGRAVGKLVQKRNLTLLPATPARLEELIAHARPDTLGGLRLVTCGDDVFDASTLSRFADAFGLRPLALLSLEAAGSVVAMNIPDVRQEGVFQKGHRDGTVGHPLPGVSIDVIDPETGDELPPGSPGRLRVSGPSVLCGAESGAGTSPTESALAVLDTELIVRIDEEGFVSLDPVTRTV